MIAAPRVARIFGRRWHRSGLTELAPGLDWAQFADGRVHRLKRKKHYRGSTRILRAQAALAAKEMGRAVRALGDELGRHEYLWVQFVDHEIALGEPCVCGGTQIERTRAVFGRCASCGATLLFKGTVAELQSEDERALQRKAAASIRANRGGSLKQDEGQAAEIAAPLVEPDARASLEGSATRAVGGETGRRPSGSNST